MLLLEDAVYAAMKGTVVESKIRDAAANAQVFVLEPDLRARGLSPDVCIETIQLVDYHGFVDLATKYDSVQAWL